MADYRELLRRAVAALPENNGAARRATYERARAALVGQLRAINPPLAARDITAHRLQLEDCIREVEMAETKSPTQPDRSDDLIVELAKLMASFKPGAVKGQAAPARTALPIPPAKPSRLPIHELVLSAEPERDGVPYAEPAAASNAGRFALPVEGDTAKEPLQALGSQNATPQIVAKSQEQSNASEDKEHVGRWRLDVSPTVFRRPKVSMEARYASVMMPFSTDLNPVYRTIKAAARDADFALGRADNIWEDQVVIEDVFSMIYRSRVVVCDFTGRNPNVFYEAGIAHTLGRDVIPIVQNKEDIPFDIRHHRYLEYKNTRSGLKVLKNRLSERFRTLSVLLL
ncbi:MAG: hypothetical protein EOP09_07475 [Proteobacteria bacterium]|nr:MAG: hypothetical protein EOP09_07475 [Pseudomonadota bacterium]